MIHVSLITSNATLKELFLAALYGMRDLSSLTSD